MRQNRDLEDFFRRVQMTLNNRGGGGGARFETSQRTTAPNMGTTGVPQHPGYTSPGFNSPTRGLPPTYTSPGFNSPVQRTTPPTYTSPGFNSPIQRTTPPSYTSPGFNSPVQRGPVMYDQIQRGNQGAPGMWNENTGAVNQPQPVPGQTRPVDPRIRQPQTRQPNYRQF